MTQLNATVTNTSVASVCHMSTHVASGGELKEQVDMDVPNLTLRCRTAAPPNNGVDV